MKRYLLSVVCAALAANAWADGPPLLPPAPLVKSEVVAAGAGPSTAQTAVTTAVGQACGAHDGHCDACPKMKTVCVSEPATIIKTKVLFSSECETKCHKAPFQFLRKGECSSCENGACGHAHVEHYLYKRVQKEVCDSYKCVPTQVPVCETSRCAPACANDKCATPVTAATQGAPIMPPATAAHPPALATLAIQTPPAAAPAQTNAVAPGSPTLVLTPLP